MKKLIILGCLLISLVTLGQTPTVNSIKYNPLGTPPSAPLQGQKYYDIDGSYYHYDGTNWIPDAGEQNNKEILMYFTGSEFNRSAARAAINNAPTFTIEEDEIYTFKYGLDTYVEDLAPLQLVFKLNGLGKGTYGVGGTQLGRYDLFYLGVMSEDIDFIADDPSTQTINLPTSTGTTVEAVWNAQPDFVVQGQGDGYRLVNITIDGVPLQYLFTGEGGTYGATSGNVSTADEFSFQSGDVPVGGLGDVTAINNQTDDKVIVEGVQFNEVNNSTEYKTDLIGYIGGGNELIIDSNKNIYSIYNDVVHKFSPLGSSVSIQLPSVASVLAVDSSDNVYTTGNYTYNIYKITPSGVVTTFATFTDRYPKKIVIDSLGNLFTNNTDNSISKIAPDGTITLNFMPSIPTNIPELTIDKEDNLYYLTNTKEIYKVTPSGIVTLFYTHNDSGNRTALVAGNDGNILLGWAKTGAGYRNSVFSINQLGQETLVGTLGGYVSGIAINTKDEIYVATEDQGVVLLKPSTHETITPNIFITITIVIDSEDNIYTISYPSHNAYKITPPEPKRLLTLDELGNIVKDDIISLDGDLISLPNATNALIDGAGGKTVPTTEWVLANVSGGSPVEPNNQIVIGNGTGVTSYTDITRRYAGALQLGIEDTRFGALFLRGNSTNSGSALIRLYNNVGNRANVSSWQIGTQNAAPNLGDFSIISNENLSQISFIIDDDTKGVSIPLTDLADYSVLGDKAVVTQEKLIDYVSKTITPDTSTIIDLSNPLGNECNMLSANASPSFTLTGTGGWAKILVNRATEPTLPIGTNKEVGGVFIPNTDIYLIVQDTADGVKYFWSYKDVAPDNSPDDTAYGISWDANMDAATKNVLYDKFESLTSAPLELTSYIGGGEDQNLTYFFQSTNVIKDTDDNTIFAKHYRYYDDFVTSSMQPTESYFVGAYAGTGSRALDTNGFGYRALQNNFGFYSSGFGTDALKDNTGNNSSGFGNRALSNNIGASSTGTGRSALDNNTGDEGNGIGIYALFQNTGNISVGVGSNSLIYNEGDGNTAIGAYAWAGFYGNISGSQTFDYTDITGNNIAITAHGFGTVGTWVNLKYTEGTGAIGNFNDDEIYQAYIVDANTISFKQARHGRDISSVGTGTGHTLTPQFSFTNTTVIGASAVPTKSQQVVLGNDDVTEVYTDGHIKTHREIKKDATTSYTLVLEDRNSAVVLNNASPVSLIIPDNSFVPFPIGTEIKLINEGSGTVTVSILGGNVLLDDIGLTINEGGMRTLIKTGTINWVIGY